MDADPTAAARRLVPHWASYWPGADVEAMAADVVRRLAAASAAWRLEDLHHLPGGHVALVAAARRDGVPVVAKIHPRGHPEEAELRAEGDALAAWAPSGRVPPLLDRGDGGLTLLMGRVVPGTPLDATRPPLPERLEILGRLASALHAAGPAPPGSRPLATVAGRWREGLGPDAHAELDDLLAPAPSDVLVHGDLHGGNALRGPAGWIAIDPHAYRADRHADVWALLDPLVPALPADAPEAARTARARVERYAGAAGMDPGRAARWARLRARTTAAGLLAAPALRPEDAAWAARLHALAAALA
jgi:streptomycin 6-kinase